MEKLSAKFEKYISITLLLLSGFFVIFQTVELLWITGEHMHMRFSSGLNFTPAPEYSRGIMIVFFNIMLMLEIMQTIKVFYKSYTLKLRIILLVCLIAVSRKVFLLDIEHNAMLEFSTAALILAISAGYYLISRTETFNKLDHEEEEA
ncbi:phosphate-starvation-inducible PsiE family protein [Flavobacterium hauense]